MRSRPDRHTPLPCEPRLPSVPSSTSLFGRHDRCKDSGEGRAELCTAASTSAWVQGLTKTRLCPATPARCERKHRSQACDFAYAYAVSADLFVFFFFNNPAPPEIYPFPHHASLPF